MFTSKESVYYFFSAQSTVHNLAWHIITLGHCYSRMFEMKGIAVVNTIHYNI